MSTRGSWPATGDADNLVADRPDCNLFLTDPALTEGVRREGAAMHEAELEDWGQRLGAAELVQQAARANRTGPVLRQYDRLGRRIDAVDFPPEWHGFLSLAFAQGMHGSAWLEPGPGAHVARAAHYLMHGQVEAGSLCPITMTSAAIPLLARMPWFDELQPRLASRQYDGRDVPLEHKHGMMVGMALTEKQGGSDLRQVRTRAEAASDGWFRITGEKWFCSSPTSDAHLALALEDDAPSCFYVPRWLADGQRNAVRILRLKDKMGNRSNASAELAFDGALGRRVGLPGRGIATLIEMATYTRMDCVLGSTALVRQALVQAVHHARHRVAFGRRLADQPLMRGVLADLAIESEAATALALRLARAFDHPEDRCEQVFRRIMTPAAKYWVCRRAIAVTAECMEVWGGNGYIEDGPMARLYREAPVNSIWEGSGNVMCLDVLRAARHDPEPLIQFVEGLAKAHADHPALPASAQRLLQGLNAAPEVQAVRARELARTLVLLVQADLLLRHAPQALAEGFVRTRLGPDRDLALGADLAPQALDDLLQRALPM